MCTRKISYSFVSMLTKLRGDKATMILKYGGKESWGQGSGGRATSSFDSERHESVAWKCGHKGTSASVGTCS